MRSTLLVASDLHGRIPEFIATAAAWQEATRIRVDALLVSGDLAIFPDNRRVDRATRKLAKTDPSELGFRVFEPLVDCERSCDPELQNYVDQWRERLASIASRFTAKLYFVGGNHEDYEYLLACKKNCSAEQIGEGVPIESSGRLRWISGGSVIRMALPTHTLSVAGVDGISPLECGRNPKKLGRLATISDDEVNSLVDQQSKWDLLLSHDCVRRFVHPVFGASVLDSVVNQGNPAYHFCGHYHWVRHPRRYADFDPTRFSGIRTVGVHLNSFVNAGPRKPRPNHSVGVLRVHQHQAVDYGFSFVHPEDIPIVD